jgi:alkylation response protein AidB-like acyl-CoA dehydrogenase
VSAPVTDSAVPLELDDYRGALRAWLGAHRDELVFPAPESFAERMEQHRTLTQVMWDQGWKRVGWPESLGGLGGGPRHRATYYDELCRAELDLPNSDYSNEVIGPAMLDYAPELAARFLPGYLSGRELWAQGFSEPDAGSDLASLRTRGVIDGDTVVVDGQKVWTSHGHLSDRILTLVRTGTPESRHKGLAALLIDTDLPGVSRNPLIFASGVDEMCETFFDGVRVPIDRMVGGPDQGWYVAMVMLQYERAMYAAQRHAFCMQRLRALVRWLDEVGHDDTTDAAIGNAWLLLLTVRGRAIESVRRLDAGEVVGPDASADKVLLARAEQTLYEVARHASAGAFVFGADEGGTQWRDEWWYSRAASIMGGAGEIQRSLIADRVLGLPREG